MQMAKMLTAQRTMQAETLRSKSDGHDADSPENQAETLRSKADCHDADSPENQAETLRSTADGHDADSPENQAETHSNQKYDKIVLFVRR